MLRVENIRRRRVIDDDRVSQIAANLRKVLLIYWSVRPIRIANMMLPLHNSLGDCSNSRGRAGGERPCVCQVDRGEDRRTFRS